MLNTILLKLTAIISSLILMLPNIFPAFTNRIATLSSVTKVSDQLYMMDYKYDYDIDTIVQDGQNTTVGMVIRALGHALLGKEDKGFACTTFNAVTPDGDYLFARNFDYTQAPGLLMWTHPENGYASMAMADLELLGYTEYLYPENEAAAINTLLAPYAIVDGINEKGLAIGVLEIEKDPTFQLSDKTNITTTGMIRIVLDKAATTKEAVELFKSYDMRDFLFGECTYHYQIADATGDTAVIEYVDGEISVIEPDHPEDNVNWITCANYLLTEGADDPLGLGFERTDVVKNALNATKGTATETEAMDILKGASMDGEDLNGYICYTLWSAVYNSQDLTLRLVAGMDYENQYQFSLNEPLVIK